MKRRFALGRITATILGFAALAVPWLNALAQRPANPIARPLPGRPDRPDRPLLPGRLSDSSDGSVAGGVQPGVFTVLDVRRSDNIVTLGDDGGRRADVIVRPDVFDLSQLSAGDKVTVDFLVPASDDPQLRAASVWKVEAKPQ